jgi:general secretion pathway protein N
VKRVAAYGLLAFSAYGLFLLWHLPATTVIDLLASRIPGLSVGRIEGSAVAGQAGDVRLGERSLRTLSWQLQPAALLRGKLEYRVTMSEPDVALEAVVSTGLDGQLHLYNVSGSLPLPKAISLAGRPPPPLNGELEVAIEELLLDRRGKPRAAWGTVQLRAAHTSFGRTLELGDVALRLSTEDAVIRGDFKDAGGPLELIGFLTLDSNNTYYFDSQVGLRASGSQDLRQALNLLGRPDSDGRWRLQRSGKLTL